MITNLNSTRLVKLFIIAILFAKLSTSHAAFPFYEPFADASASSGTTYTVGNVLKGNVNATGDVWFGTGTTTAGTKALVNGGSLSYPGLWASSGNSFQTHSTSGEGGRMFVSSQTSGGASGITNQNVTIYYSLIAQLSDITALSTNGDYWIGFNNQGTINDQTGQPGIQGARLYFKKNDASTFYVGIGKNGTNIVFDTTLRSTSDVLFIVAGYQMNSAGGAGTDDNAYLWVNPDSSTFGQSAAPTTKSAQMIGTDADITFISSFVILDRSASCASTATIDEVRVGKTWTFVTGGPEFASIPPASTNVASQATVNLSGNAKSGSGTALAYKWQKNGANLSDTGNVSGSATANLTLSSVSVADAGSYSLIATDSVGSATNVTLVNVSRPGASFWRGGNIANPTAWDHSTSNWFNSTTRTLDIFHDGDATVFDDTAITNLVTVIGTNAFTAMATSNNVTPLTFIGSGGLSGPLDIEGTSSVTFALDTAPAFNSITNNAGALIFALGGGTNTILTPISDNGAGQGTIIQNANNTLTLSANNSAYNGKIVVKAGTLKAGIATGLGSSLGSIIVSNGGTLDLGGFNVSNNPVVVQGPGASGVDGAIIDSGAGAQQALARVTLAGDTTFNATGARWDIGTNTVTGAYINGNGYALTKTGGQTIILKDVGETGIGDVHVVGGRLGFQGTITVGDPTKTITAESGTVLTFFSVSDGQTKNVVLNSATIDSGGVANNFYGPITLNGVCTIGLRSTFNVYSNIVGTGSLIATVNDSVGNGAAGTSIHLNGANTYTGWTLIRTNSGMVLGANATLASPLIQMDIGGIFDTTAIPTFTFTNGQTFAGSGTFAGSSVIFSSGSTLAPGPSNALGSLTFGASPTFQHGSTVIFKLDPGSLANDEIYGLNTVTFGGTLVLSNLNGAPYSAGNTFTLFSASVSQGTFDAIVPATPGAGLKWDTNNLTVNGSIAVVAAPHFTGSSLLPDGNLQMTFSGPVGHQYTVLASTNVALSLTNWTPILSGTIDTDPFTVSDLSATNFLKRFYTIGIGQ
jgi:autotransporter-associated beta strand protein